SNSVRVLTDRRPMSLPASGPGDLSPRPEAKGTGDARVPQAQRRPEEGRHVDRKEDVTEERVLDSHVRGDGSAEIPCPQNRAEKGSARDQIEDEQHRLQDAERDDGTGWIPKLGRYLDGRRNDEELHRGVHRQEENGEPAHDASRPD